MFKFLLKGALYIPGDGVGDPYNATLTLASEAARLGMEFICKLIEFSLILKAFLGNIMYIF